MDQTAIYLNHHADPLPCKGSLEAISKGLEEEYRILYDFLSASDAHIAILTSSGAEAITQVLWSLFLHQTKEAGKTEFVTFANELPTTLQMFKRYEEFGCTARIIPLNAQGSVDLATLASSLGPRTACISLSMVDPLTGVIQPWEEAALLAHAKNIPFHLDASYALCSMPFFFDQSNIDYLTFAGEYLHAAQDCGVIMAKQNAFLAPLIPGGIAQGGLRAGRLNRGALTSLVGALLQAKSAYDAFGLETARLRDLLEKSIPEARVLYQNALRAPNTSFMAFPHVHPEALAYYLQRNNLHFNQWNEQGISFSLSRMATEGEMIKAARIIQETVLYLKKMTEDLV